MTNNIHAHVDTYSVDCDGPISRSYVMTMNDDELAEKAAAEVRGYNDFSDIHFHERVLSNVVNTYSLFQGGRLEVSNLDNDGIRLEWSEQTEEGHRRVEALICTDDCDTEESSYRDHRAEQYGY